MVDDYEADQTSKKATKTNKKQALLQKKQSANKQSAKKTKSKKTKGGHYADEFNWSGWNGGRKVI